MTQLTGTIPTDHTLTLLQRLVPPGAVIHIGSGTGVGPMHSWRNWGVPRALLLDAAYGLHLPAWANTDAAPPGWSYEAALLSNMDGTTCIYQASNPAESGLLKPEELNMIWPNLSTTEQEQRPVTRLESLLAEPRHTELRAAANIWCIVDCLPALPILQGAGKELQNWSVLWLRVLLKPFDGELQQGTLPACRELLEPLGFQCLQVNESNHPALGDAIFVRDWAAWLQPRLVLQEKLAADEHMQLKELSGDREKLFLKVGELQTKLEQLDEICNVQSTLAQERQLQIAELTVARDEQTRLAEGLQASVSQLLQEKDNLFNLAAEHLAQLEQLTEAHDTKARLADELQASFIQLQQEKENLFNLAAERLAQLEQLTIAQDEQTVRVQEQQSQISELTTARNEQNRLAEERQAECNSLKIRLQETESSKAMLESQLAELEHRQQLMNEEMVKAEGQIELIKDLLLREPGL